MVGMLLASSSHASWVTVARQAAQASKENKAAGTGEIPDLAGTAVNNIVMLTVTASILTLISRFVVPGMLQAKKEMLNGMHPRKS